MRLRVNRQDFLKDGPRRYAFLVWNITLESTGMSKQVNVCDEGQLEGGVRTCLAKGLASERTSINTGSHPAFRFLSLVMGGINCLVGIK